MWKGKYHISPPFGLLNDPNGLIYWNKEYHVFYQWNPKECKHGAKHWAHLRSKDLINWETLPAALEATDWFDKNGCYSGSAIEKDGNLYLFYTGNVKNNNIRESYQCLAFSKDGVTFEKKGPVIHDKDIPKEYTKHFRDPKVFYKDGTYKMVLGAQRENLTGTIVVFKSDNLLDWIFEGEILKGDFGFMCECPDFISIENRKALLFSPQGIAAQNDLYNNRFQSGYVIRDLFESDKNDFIELDRGFEFYAPQTFSDEFNDTVLIAWMGMPEEIEHPSILTENWIHSLTIPRKLEIVNGKILQKPHTNLSKLRKEKILLENVRIDSEYNLSELGIAGETCELIINFKDLCHNVAINIREGTSEKTTFLFDAKNKKAILNREFSGSGYAGVRKCLLERLDKFHIFIDRSSIEIFLNDGEEVFTANIYPDKNSLGIRIISEVSLVIPEILFYKF